MVRFRAAALLVLVCQATLPLAAQQRPMVAVPGFPTPIGLDTLAIGQEVAAARGRVFSAVVEAFRTLKVPLPRIDSAQGVLANWGFRAPRNLAGQRLSTWLSCGTTMTGLVADEYRVAVWIHTTLAAKGPETTTLRTALVAGATSVDGASRQPMPCLSTGRFEALVQQLVEEWLAAHP